MQEHRHYFGEDTAYNTDIQHIAHTHYICTNAGMEGGITNRQQADYTLSVLCPFYYHYDTRKQERNNTDLTRRHQQKKCPKNKVTQCKHLQAFCVILSISQNPQTETKRHHQTAHRDSPAHRPKTQTKHEQNRDQQQDYSISGANKDSTALRQCPLRMTWWLAMGRLSSSTAASGSARSTTCVRHKLSSY